MDELTSNLIAIGFMAGLGLILASVSLVLLSVVECSSPNSQNYQQSAKASLAEHQAW